MTEPRPAKPPTFAGWLGSMWLYTILRFGLFFALWGLLAMAGLHGLIGALVAIVLSVPLSFVLLARPRARFAANIERRVNARRESRADLDEKLAGEDDEAR
jgi:predicted lipid-binding transport protein (Tim44 family)